MSDLCDLRDPSDLSDLSALCDPLDLSDLSYPSDLSYTMVYWALRSVLECASWVVHWREK